MLPISTIEFPGRKAGRIICFWFSLLGVVWLSFAPVGAQTGLTTSCGECYTFSYLRSLSRSELAAIDPELGLLYDKTLATEPNASGQATSTGKKLAYTLEEFWALYQSNNHQTANTECIGGLYARYVIGNHRELPDDDPAKYEIFISNPYQADEVSAAAYEDKTKYFGDLLNAQCLIEAEKGWISIGEWGKLLGTGTTPTLRLTNRNFSELGRIVGEGEYLEMNSPTGQYLTNKQISVPDLRGPNFPTLGYFSRTGTDFDFELKRMQNNAWTYDAENDVPYRQGLTPRWKIKLNIDQLEDGSHVYTLDGEIISSIARRKYVIDCMGNIFLIPADFIRPPDVDTKHSQALGGAAVVSAGFLDIHGEGIVELNNITGHYQTECRHLENAISYLKALHNMRFRKPFKPNPANILCQTSLCTGVALEVNSDQRRPDRDGDPSGRTVRVPRYIDVVKGQAVEGNEATITFRDYNNPPDVEVHYIQESPTRFQIASDAPVAANSEIVFHEVYFRPFNISPETPVFRIRAFLTNCEEEEEENTVQTLQLSSQDDNQVEVALQPNPNQGKAVVRLTPQTTSLSVEVTDAYGKRIYGEQIRVQSGVPLEHAVHLENQPNGLYLLKVQEGSRIKTKRVLVQK